MHMKDVRDVLDDVLNIVEDDEREGESSGNSQ